MKRKSYSCFHWPEMRAPFACMGILYKIEVIFCGSFLLYFSFLLCCTVFKMWFFERLFFLNTPSEKRTSLASPTIVSQQASDTRCGRNFSHTSSKNQFCHGHQLSFSNSIQFWQHLLEDSVRSHRLRAQSYKTAPHLGCQLQTPGCFVCAAGWPSFLLLPWVLLTC